MNNLVYGNQDSAKLGAAVEEIVRKDVGSATPLTYRLLDVATDKATIGSVLTDIGSALFGGSSMPLLTVELDLPGPMGGALQAQLVRQGVGAYCGGLVFAFRLTKPVSGEVGFEEHKSFGTPKFTGDAAAAGRLNGARDLAKRADKVLRTEVDLGSVKVKTGRVFRLAPADGGSVLVLGSLPRLTSLGMGATTDAKDILELAAMVNAAI